MFAHQYQIDQPTDVIIAPNPSGTSPWVAFPWSLREGLEQPGCGVWIENPERRARVRHIRFYSSTDAAEQDNRRINDIVSAGF